MSLLFIGKTKINRSKEVPVGVGHTVHAEGQALVSQIEDGNEVCKPAAGGDGDKFLGLSYGHVFTPATLSLVEEKAVPSESEYTIALDHEPLTGQILIYNKTTGTALTEVATDSPADGEFVINGKTVTFNSAQAGNEIRFQYRFSPSAWDIMMQSDINIYTSTPTEFIGSIGVIQKGEVYTDMFDASVDWSAATGVRLASGGILTDHNGSGDSIKATITHFPSVDEPFLGLRL